MKEHIEVDGLKALVRRKKIKNMYLRVLPPDGRIEISAPHRLSEGKIVSFTRSRRQWIERKRKEITQQPPMAPKSYRNGEEHMLWGQPHSLQLLPGSKRKTGVEKTNHILRLHLRTRSSLADRRTMLEAWLRRELRAEAEKRIPYWEEVMGVKVSKLFVRRMRSLWGSCNPRKRSIRLNTALAEMDPQYLEYILVHEMTHILEPSHNKRFYALMSQFLPDWQQRRRALKKFSLRSS